MLTPSAHARYVLEFIEAYLAHPDCTLSRELACQRVRLGYVLEDIREDEVFAGRLAFARGRLFASGSGHGLFSRSDAV